MTKGEFHSPSAQFEMCSQYIQAPAGIARQKLTHCQDRASGVKLSWFMSSFAVLLGKEVEYGDFFKKNKVNLKKIKHQCATVPFKNLFNRV